MTQNEQPNGNSHKASNGHNNGGRVRRRRVWIVIFTGVLFAYVALVLVSVYHPYLTERVKFGTETGLSLAILIFVIVQAFITNRQWQVMDGQLEAMQAQSALIKQQVDLAVINERAYLRLRSWEAPRFEGSFLILGARIMNGGRTPAWEVCGHTRVGVDYEPAPYPLVPSEDEESLLDAQPFLVIGASEDAMLPLTPLKVRDQQIRLVKDGHMKIFVDGVCRYLDSLGGKQFYTYGFTVNWDGSGVSPRYERHHRVKAD